MPKDGKLFDEPTETKPTENNSTEQSENTQTNVSEKKDFEDILKSEDMQNYLAKRDLELKKQILEETKPKEKEPEEANEKVEFYKKQLEQLEQEKKNLEINTSLKEAIVENDLMFFKDWIIENVKIQSADEAQIKMKSLAKLFEKQKKKAEEDLTNKLKKGVTTPKGSSSSDDIKNIVEHYAKKQNNRTGGASSWFKND